MRSLVVFFFLLTLVSAQSIQLCSTSCNFFGTADCSLSFASVVQSNSSLCYTAHVTVGEGGYYSVKIDGITTDWVENQRAQYINQKWDFGFRTTPDPGSYSVAVVLMKDNENIAEDSFDLEVRPVQPSLFDSLIANITAMQTRLNNLLQSASAEAKQQLFVANSSLTAASAETKKGNYALAQSKIAEADYRISKALEVVPQTSGLPSLNLAIVVLVLALITLYMMNLIFGSK